VKPIHLREATWHVIDVAVALFFIASLLFVNEYRRSAMSESAR
jgi:intracellular septation protein A